MWKTTLLDSYVCILCSLFLKFFRRNSWLKDYRDTLFNEFIDYFRKFFLRKFFNISGHNFTILIKSNLELLCEIYTKYNLNMKFLFVLVIFVKFISNRLIVNDTLHNKSSLYNRLKRSDRNSTNSEIQILLKIQNHFCKNDCSDHGFCLDNRCYCIPGFFGEDCSLSNKKCINNCSEKGECIDGVCACQPNYGGIDCSVSILPIIHREMRKRL